MTELDAINLSPPDGEMKAGGCSSDSQGAVLPPFLKMNIFLIETLV